MSTTCFEFYFVFPIDIELTWAHNGDMTTNNTFHDMPTYTVTITKPSRSKCPNAWARIEDGDEVYGTFAAEHGTRLRLGGDIRRATRSERIKETVTIDECGEWSAFGGAGSIKIELAS